MTEQDKETLRSELRTIMDRFGRVDAMVSILGTYPGFDGINRSTVFRWLDKPCRRTKAAVVNLNLYLNTGSDPQIDKIQELKRQHLKDLKMIYDKVDTIKYWLKLRIDALRAGLEK